jgi:hypothetical protein
MLYNYYTTQYQRLDVDFKLDTRKKKNSIFLFLRNRVIDDDFATIEITIESSVTTEKPI